MAAEKQHPADEDDDIQWRVYCPIHRYAIPCENKGTAEHLQLMHNNSPDVCPDNGAKIGKHGAIMVERMCEGEGEGDGCDHITEKRFLAEGDDGKLRCSPCDKRYNDQHKENDNVE